MKSKTFTSDISHKPFSLNEKISAKAIRTPLLNYIQSKNPSFSSDSVLAMSEYNIFREEYISDFLSKELGDLSELEKKVVDSFQNNTTLTDKIDITDDTSISFGQRVADKVATFGGSWTFIILFSAFLLLWIGMNVWWFKNQSFDPYPFILLNLILSCIAAMQAPIIMMSQNRQEEKDRIRAQNDYMINLKSEVEIRMLHEKIDHLILHQQEELFEIQRIQIDMMEEILQHLAHK